jgi:hypothetical protein
MAHQRLGREEKAREILKKARDLKPGEAWPWDYLLQVRRLEAEARSLIEGSR